MFFSCASRAFVLLGSMYVVAILMLSLQQVSGAFSPAQSFVFTENLRQKARRLVEGADSNGATSGPTLTSDVSQINGLGGDVTVSWSGVSFTKTYDWIGMWSAERNLTLFSAPIKFKYLLPNPNTCASHAKDHRCKDDPACTWNGHSCVAGVPASNGSLSFHVQNMRTDVVFFYVSGDIQYPELIAASQSVKMADPQLPQGVHLALGSELNSMRVYWRAGGKVGSPGVKYGLGYSFENTSTNFVKGSADPGRIYTEDDMCDRGVQPAGRQGWMPPPNLLSAEIKDLVAGQVYWYIYGDSSTGWSEPRHFTAPPAVNRSRRTVVAAFGDMGQTETDGSWHHSWDYNDKGELPSLNTTRNLFQDEEIELVLHIGDISYAVGFLSEWENFFWQIEPVASRKPWMTAIGNHEQGTHDSFYPGVDSGGECGVPYNAFFPFASQDPTSSTPFSKRQPWYSFVYGNAAFVQMSTEHDYTPGSPQYAWIEKTLSAVNRDDYPWLVFTGHRPMYVGSDYPGDQVVAEQLRGAVEPLLLKYKVDIALWGHFHTYERFCEVADTKCVSEGGVQHLLIGMAGYDHSQCPNSSFAYMNTCNDKQWGYMRMTFENASSAMFEFVADDGSLMDAHVMERKH